MCFRRAILIIHGFAGGTYDQEYLANYLELERKFIGIDLEKEYLDLSVKRFEQVFSKKDKVKWQ